MSGILTPIVAVNPTPGAEFITVDLACGHAVTRRRIRQGQRVCRCDLCVYEARHGRTPYLRISVSHAQMRGLDARRILQAIYDALGGR